MTVSLVVPAVKSIALSGGAQATIKGLETASIEAEAHGGSRVTLLGTAGAVELRSGGGSDADLRDLSARTITLELSGDATATVNATDEIIGSASGGARLTVLGDAEVALDTSGGAEVVNE